MLGDDETLGYLLGLMLGRGRILSSQRRLLIEFPHKNPLVAGIALCDACGWLATGQQNLRCKNPACRKSVAETARPLYEQTKSTKVSIENVIAPLIAAVIPCNYRIGSGTYSTHLVIDFPSSSVHWQQLNNDLGTGKSHHDFLLPARLSKSSDSVKREFINGLLDTAGFVNAGSWMPRDGRNGHGRMRLYFQVVRNWSFVVQIDNFLRREFDIPVQTIDWGHPNIRSAGGSEQATSSVSREHQIKIFPEYMQQFQFRVTCKQKLFQELTSHNLRVGFDRKEDWFPPRPLSVRDVVPQHPAEDDPRIPRAVRRHFNKSWQLNLALGCEYLLELAEGAQDFEVFALTGNLNSSETLEAAKSRLRIAVPRRSLTPRVASVPQSRRPLRATPEHDTYEPLRAWLEGLLRADDDPKSVAWITADQSLSRFLHDLDDSIIANLEDLEDLRIRPDIVGYSPRQNSLAFVESKVTPITVSEIGQIRGYCLVAQPAHAYLISTKPIDEHVKELVLSTPELITYGTSAMIQILHFDTSTMSQPLRFQNA